MALLAFYTGAFVGMLALTLIINGHRAKRGYDNPSGSAIWALWVAEAFYGAGSREDWRIDEAFAYVVCALFFWAWFTFRKRQVKTEI